MGKSVFDIFLDLVKISSLSGNEQGIREYIIDYVGKYPVSYEVDDIGNLIVEIKKDSDMYLLFDAHMDTVAPCEKITPVIKDGYVYSDGTSILGADDKAGIALCLALIDTLSEMRVPFYSLRFVFSVSEEVGLKGAKGLDDKYLQDVLYAFALDGEGEPGSVVNKTPYSCKGNLIFKGREAHAGVCPEKGINALYVAAHAITKMPNGRVNENTTCNIGVVEGGVATNVVMPEVRMKFEARSYHLEELENLIDDVKLIATKTAEDFHAQFNSALGFGTKGYHISVDDDLISFFKKACLACNLQFVLESCGGASNANVYRQRNVNAINIGVGMKEVHTCNEYIKIEDLENTYHLLLNLIKY